MKFRSLTYLAYFLLWVTSRPAAQHVLYSPSIIDSFSLTAKAGSYYWIERFEKRHLTFRNKREPAAPDRQFFDIYDGRMNYWRSTPSLPLGPSALKEYCVSNVDFFDRLVLYSRGPGVELLVDRFSCSGDRIWEAKKIYNFSFTESPGSFLLVRSADLNKMLLLCFETIPSSGLLLHAILFDRNWVVLSHVTYRHPGLSEPFIQDDFLSYPADYFNSSPLKLANDGQWLMIAPSRWSGNFLLFHFSAMDSQFVFKEIPLPPYSNCEDVALSINEQTREAFAGILSKFEHAAWKNVQVIHYSLLTQQFDFDSSYRFSTLFGYHVKDDNLVRERFLTVPGAGFMLLKEYGKPFSFDQSTFESDDFLELATSFAMDSISGLAQPLLISPRGYTRFSQLGGARRSFERGDLSLFYFPGNPLDSCWSGLINREQITDFNSASLSYLVIAQDQKIILLYNSFLTPSRDQQFANSTILDYKGNLLSDQNLIVWKTHHSLSFQRSLQATPNEVLLPYSDFRRTGFASIQF